MPRDHLVGDPAGIRKIPPSQVVLGQGLEIVHVVRFELDGPAQRHFGLLVFAQEIVENPEVVVHPGPIGDAAGGERQMLFGLDIFLFLGQQQPQRILNVIELRIGLDDLAQQRLGFGVPAQLAVEHGQVHFGRVRQVVDFDGRLEAVDGLLRLA